MVGMLSIQMSQTVKISEPVKERLEEYRDNMGHTSLDSAIREIMLKAGVEIEHNEESDNNKNRDEDSFWEVDK